jgi:hypothetical protein
MKRTLFASLVSGLSRIFSGPQLVEVENNRPLEQIINEGSLGKVEVIPESTKPKTQAEFDFEYLKQKNVSGSLIVMSDNRYVDLIRLAIHNKEVDEWLGSLQGKLDFIFLDDVVNIGIVKAH